MQRLLQRFAAGATAIAAVVAREQNACRKPARVWNLRRDPCVC
jgi:hypothetical protein